MLTSLRSTTRYALHEVFLTLQGEGLNAGRAAVFCRFAGCNLWSGREADRADATCRFCDTEFVGTGGQNGGRHDASALVALASRLWQGGGADRLVVLTGGEPLLQVDAALLAAFHAADFEVAVETNGTVAPPAGIDWLCVSPKAGATLVVRAGDELKLVFPQQGAPPSVFEHLAFRHFLLQPMDGPDQAAATREAIAYCLAHPRWRLSVQTHKVLGIA